MHLCFLNGESRVDEKNGVFSFFTFRYCHEGGETGLHGTHGRDDTFRLDVDVHEVLHELGTFFLEFLVAFEHRVELSASGT